jgi:hypothetical protein
VGGSLKVSIVLIDAGPFPTVSQIFKSVISATHKCNYEPKSLQSMSCFHLQINVPGIPNHSLQQVFDAGNVIRSHATVSIFTVYVCMVFLWKKMYIEPVNTDGFTHSLSLFI